MLQERTKCNEDISEKRQQVLSDYDISCETCLCCMSELYSRVLCVVIPSLQLC